MSSQLANATRLEQSLASGDLAAAIGSAQALISAGSAPLSVHLKLIACYLKSNRYSEACDAVVAAAGRRSRNPNEVMELARRLLQFNESGKLVGLAARLLSNPVWNAQAEADLAVLVSMVGEQNVASRLLDRAIVKIGLSPDRQFNRSQIRMYQARFKEAESDLWTCALDKAAGAKALWALSKLPRAESLERLATEICTLLPGLTKGSQDEVFCRFASFNVLDRLGRREEAWNALAEGCAAKRKLVTYDPAATAEFFGALAALPVPVRHEPTPAGDATQPIPIFIVGMHRSGTTLLERILGQHPAVASGGELYDFPAQLRWAVGKHFPGASDRQVADRVGEIDFPEVGRRYLERIRWRAQGRQFLVDKLPSNFINIGFIRRALPNARIVHMRRRPMDTCFSNLKELFSTACPYSYDQDEIGGYYSQYRQLMAHWLAIFPDEICDVDYEVLAANPEPECRRIFDRCGLAWDPACLNFEANPNAVNSASSAQVREPIHLRSINAWRRYEDFLDPLRQRLLREGFTDLDE